MNLKEIAKKHSDKLKKIKVLLFDVDGILTNGIIYWSGEEVGFNRFFHAHDGYGIKMMRKAGLKVGIITGGNSVGVKQRFDELGVDYLFMGNEDKRAALDSIQENEKVTDEECLYMGDEFFDLPLLKRVGFSATVPEASLEIQEEVDYVSIRKGGEGCVREVVDLLRYAQNIVPKIEGYNA